MRIFSVRYYGNLYRYKPGKFVGVIRICQRVYILGVTIFLISVYDCMRADLLLFVTLWVSYISRKAGSFPGTHFDTYYVRFQFWYCRQIAISIIYLLCSGASGDANFRAKNPRTIITDYPSYSVNKSLPNTFGTCIVNDNFQNRSKSTFSSDLSNVHWNTNRWFCCWYAEKEQKTYWDGHDMSKQ